MTKGGVRLTSVRYKSLMNRVENHDCCHLFSEGHKTVKKDMKNVTVRGA